MTSPMIRWSLINQAADAFDHLPTDLAGQTVRGAALDLTAVEWQVLQEVLRGRAGMAGPVGFKVPPDQ